jgi:hypothetical protein
VHSLLQQIKLEWKCTSTVAAMRMKLFDVYNYSENIGNLFQSNCHCINDCKLLSILTNAIYDKNNLDEGNLLKARPEMTTLECFLSIPQTNFFKGSLRTQKSKLQLFRVMNKNCKCL